jgi:hypothetical protein
MPRSPSLHALKYFEQLYGLVSHTFQCSSRLCLFFLYPHLRFDDWFKDAAKATDWHGNAVEPESADPKSDPVKDGELEEVPSGSEEEDTSPDA